MKSIGENLASVMDELVQQARQTAIEHDDRTLQEFARKLKGLGDAENDDETMGLLRGVSVPEGFRHARYTIYEVIGSGPNGELLLGDPKPGGRLIDGRMGCLDLKRLVRTALVFTSDPDTTSMGPGRWLESFALPIRDPGTLELGLVVEPREINDGSFPARVQATIRMVEERRTSVRKSRSAYIGMASTWSRNSLRDGSTWLPSRKGPADFLGPALRRARPATVRLGS